MGESQAQQYVDQLKAERRRLIAAVTYGDHVDKAQLLAQVKRITLTLNQNG